MPFIAFFTADGPACRPWLAAPVRSALLRSVLLPAALVLAALGLAGCAGPAPKPATDAAALQANQWSPRMEAKRKALEAATADSGIAVLRTRNNELQANVPSDFSFDTDSAVLKPKMKLVLDHFAGDLKEAGLSSMRILIVGHTDSRGPEAVNDVLSLARASAVAHYLEGRGIAPSRIAVEGRGEREPLVGNAMPITRALNRRVEMFLSEPVE